MLFYDFVVLSGMPWGVVLGVFYYKLLPLDMKYLTYFFILTLVFEIGADYAMIVEHKNNLPFYHTMALLQFVFLSLYLRHNIPDGKVQRLIICTIIFVLFLELLLVFTWQPLHQSPSWIRLITRLLLLYWILLYLKSLLGKKELEPLMQLPTF